MILYIWSLLLIHIVYPEIANQFKYSIIILFLNQWKIEFKLDWFDFYITANCMQKGEKSLDIANARQTMIKLV